MKAPISLIQRVKEHIQGETSENLNNDIKLGIRQIIPDETTKALMLQSGNTLNNPK